MKTKSGLVLGLAAMAVLAVAVNDVQAASRHTVISNNRDNMHVGGWDGGYHNRPTSHFGDRDRAWHNRPYTTSYYGYGATYYRTVYMPAPVYVMPRQVYVTPACYTRQVYCPPTYYNHDGMSFNFRINID